MIDLHWLYALAGAVFGAFALTSAGDRSNPKRWGNAAFWGLIAVSFWFGDLLGDLGNGALVLALVALAGFHLIGKGQPATTGASEREASALKLGNRLFLPALIIPFTAFAGTLLFNYTPLKDVGLIEPKAVTLVLLGAGVILALAVAMLWLRPTLLAPVQEGRRLMDSIGWAALLPQMLAALGAIFAAAGIGTTVGAIASAVLPDDNIFIAVLLYAFGMAAFTMIMGNAFAAFPVMAAAIGVPILIQQAGGNPAVIGAVGMLAGFCGTLCTPMAANFNIVPAALLELNDQHGVIKAQVPTAIALFVVNVAIIYVGGFLL